MRLQRIFWQKTGDQLRKIVGIDWRRPINWSDDLRCQEYPTQIKKIRSCPAEYKTQMQGKQMLGTYFKKYRDLENVSNKLVESEPIRWSVQRVRPKWQLTWSNKCKFNNTRKSTPFESTYLSDWYARSISHQNLRDRGSWISHALSRIDDEIAKSRHAEAMLLINEKLT